MRLIWSQNEGPLSKVFLNLDSEGRKSDACTPHIAQRTGGYYIVHSVPILIHNKTDLKFKLTTLARESKLCARIKWDSGEIGRCAFFVDVAHNELTTEYRQELCQAQPRKLIRIKGNIFDSFLCESTRCHRSSLFA